MLQLFIFYCNEIKLGFANKGNYKLDPVYSKYKMESQYILTRNETSPEDIVKELHYNPESFLKTTGCSEPVLIHGTPRKYISNHQNIVQEDRRKIKKISNTSLILVRVNTFLL